MTKAHHLKARKSKAVTMAIPLNFLLGCSELSLDNYELARLAETADLRKEFHILFDRLIEQSALAMLAKWFRQSDRDAILQTLAIEESPTEWAKRQIKEGQRSEDDLLPLPSLPPGAGHLAAALRYQERNIAEGKCRYCPKPLDRNSVDMCTEHLVKARARKKPMGSETPGSVDWLYRDGSEIAKGREPSNLARLEMNREKKTRAVLAELGIPPESAAVSLKAAKEALLAHMPGPDSEGGPMTADDLFEAATVPSRTTGFKALLELFSSGKIQRTGKGARGSAFRYYASESRPKQKPSPKKKNEALLKILRGEEVRS